MRGKVCAICGRPAWGGEAERRVYDRQSGRRVRKRGHFCIYHHPDPSKAEEFKKAFCGNYQRVRGATYPMGLIKEAYTHEGKLVRYYDVSHFIFPPRFSFPERKVELELYALGAEFLGDADFSRFDFESANFSDVIFHGRASFRGARFGRRKSSFGGAIFKEGADFSRARFGYGAYFDKAKFAKDAVFESAGLGWGRTDFWGTKFSAKANFRNAGSTGEVQFYKSVFRGEAIFDSVAFKNAKFQRVRFLGPVSFKEARFLGEVKDYRDHVKFAGGAMFVSKDLPVDNGGFVLMEITGEVVFENTFFHEEVVFDKARMGGLVKFGEVHFRKKVSFKGARFDRTIVSSTQFEDWADFTDASFLELHLSQSQFLKGASFKKARFLEATLDEPTFSHADFSGAEFFNRLEAIAVRVNGDISFEGATFHMGATMRFKLLKGALVLDEVNSGKSIKLVEIPREKVSRVGAKVLGGIRFALW